MSCTNIFNFVFTLHHWCQWCYQWWYTHVIRYAQRSHCCRSLNQSRCTLLVIDRIIDRKTRVSISWMVFFFIFDQDDFLLYLTSDQLSLARFVAFTSFLAFIWSKFDSHHSSIAWEMWRMDEPPQAIWDFRFWECLVNIQTKLDQANCANSSFESCEKELCSAWAFGLILFGKHTRLQMEKLGGGHCH